VKPTAPDDPWQRFAAAARHSQHMTAPPGNGQAPAGLVARVVARAMQARREFLALLWERWSWRVALATASVAVALGCFVVRHKTHLRLDVPATTLDVPPL